MHYPLSLRVPLAALAAIFLSQASTYSQSFSATFPDSVDVGAGWHVEPKLGAAWQESFPWVYFEDHGWWYIQSAAPGEFWAFDADLGWLWSSTGAYPHAYVYDRVDWAAFVDPQGGRRSLYYYWTEAFEYADASVEEQLEALAIPAMRLFVQRLNQTVSTIASNRYPTSTPSDGEYGNWRTNDSSTWVSGFLPGTLWLMYLQTGDEHWKTQADKWTRNLAGLRTKTDTHDLGFMVGIPFIHAHALTGDDYYQNIVLETSASLSTRFNTDTIGAMRSWSWAEYSDGFNFTTIIDNMMNLEMLLWAAQQPGGQQFWFDASVQHALTSHEHLVREDGSTYHLVIFDERDGSVVRRGTYQGYDDDSAWSRGQAWAIYGFTVLYRETGDERFLEAARQVTDYFLDHMPANNVPPYDFLDFWGIEEAPKDTSAGAICASALFMLADLENDAERASRYTASAQDLLFAMIRGDYLSRDVQTQAVLLEGSGAYGNHQLALIYGDYYLLEAMLRFSGKIPPAELP